MVCLRSAMVCPAVCDGCSPAAICDGGEAVVIRGRGSRTHSWQGCGELTCVGAGPGEGPEDQVYRRSERSYRDRSDYRTERGRSRRVKEEECVRAGVEEVRCEWMRR